MTELNRRTNLAPAYQLALDLEAEGLEGVELAERLGVPAAALPSLLRLAHAKAGDGHNSRPDADPSTHQELGHVADPRENA